MPSAASTAWLAWSGSSSGAFQNAIRQSPIYLSIVPPCASTISDSGVSSRLISVVSRSGSSFSALGDGGEAAHVAEQDGQLLPLAAELQLRRVAASRSTSAGDRYCEKARVMPRRHPALGGKIERALALRRPDI